MGGHHPAPRQGVGRGASRGVGSLLGLRWQGLMLVNGRTGRGSCTTQNRGCMLTRVNGAGWYRGKVKRWDGDDGS